MRVSMTLATACSAVIFCCAFSARAAGPGTSPKIAGSGAPRLSAPSTMPLVTQPSGSPCDGDKQSEPLKPGQQSSTQIDWEAEEDPREPCDQTLDEDVD
jgi:hypothetical protein